MTSAWTPENWARIERDLRNPVIEPGPRPYESPDLHHCSNCAHWKRPQMDPNRMDFGLGTCAAIEDDTNLASHLDAKAFIEFFEPDNPYGPAPTLTTAHNFGCVLWKEMTDERTT